MPRLEVVGEPLERGVPDARERQLRRRRRGRSTTRPSPGPRMRAVAPVASGSSVGGAGAIPGLCRVVTPGSSAATSGARLAHRASRPGSPRATRSRRCAPPRAACRIPRTTSTTCAPSSPDARCGRSVADRLDHVVQADAARVERAARGVRHVLPAAAPALRRTRALEGVRVGQHEHALGAVDHEVADVQPRRVEARHEVREHAALELHRRSSCASASMRVKRSPARGPIWIVRTRRLVDAKPATRAIGPSSAVIAVR